MKLTGTLISSVTGRKTSKKKSVFVCPILDFRSVKLLYISGIHEHFFIRLKFHAFQATFSSTFFIKIKYHYLYNIILLASS